MMNSYRKRDTTFYLSSIGFIIAILIVLIYIIFPFYWALVSSLKQADELIQTPTTYWPTHVTFNNYLAVLSDPQIVKGLINSSIFGQTAEPDLSPTLDLLVGDENTFMYDYGGGIRFFGSEKAGFRIDARQVHYDSSSRGRQDHIEIGFAVTLVLGGA